MRLEHHLVGGYVRYVSPHIIIIIIVGSSTDLTVWDTSVKHIYFKYSLKLLYTM